MDPATLPDHPPPTPHGDPAVPGCEVPWSYPDRARPCPEPAAVVVRDTTGTEALLCTAHWLDALSRSSGAIRAIRLVRSRGRTRGVR
jgi:hypothetical protein